MNFKAGLKRYGILLGCYLSLLLVTRIVLINIESWTSHFARFLMGGWFFWYFGPTWWGMPVSRIHLPALLVYHGLYLFLFAYATKRVENPWLVALIMLPVAWVTGYFLALWQGGNGLVHQFISGYYQ